MTLTNQTTSTKKNNMKNKAKPNLTYNTTRCKDSRQKKEKPTGP
jgi:hypothetical protein